LRHASIITDDAVELCLDVDSSFDAEFATTLQTISHAATAAAIRWRAMPRYLVIHHAPGVTAEDFQRSVPAVLEGKFATFVQCYANLVDGVIINLYDGDSEAAVARELERIGFPFDEIKELQFAASAEELRKLGGG
jgi:hypothetical protein